MYAIEFLVFLASGYFTFKFYKSWYPSLFNIWPPERNKLTRYIFAVLPMISFAIILYTLRVLAAFDVVGSFFYIVYYILLGFAWLYFSLKLMALFFDLSWFDDALSLNNKAAIIPTIGGFLGSTIIYSGANIGDGPGWWCVIFAGGLGLIAWILLAIFINNFTQVFEGITVERDIYCGIRFGFYLLASGIILGRASAGDWTSFYMTIVEFMVGWPVLPLTLLALMVEGLYKFKSKMENSSYANYLLGSIIWGVAYVLIAVVSVKLLPPLI